MNAPDDFWDDPGCVPGMDREATEEYLRQIAEGYQARGMDDFGEAFAADAHDRISALRPGPSAEQVEAWEADRGVRLPGTLRQAVQVQDGGYVRGTRLLINPLAEMTPLVGEDWDHLMETEENRGFGDPARLIRIGEEDNTGGILILDGNVGTEPRMIWLWRDLGDELRDEGEGTFDELIADLRDLQGRSSEGLSS